MALVSAEAPSDPDPSQSRNHLLARLPASEFHSVQAHLSIVRLSPKEHLAEPGAPIPAVGEVSPPIRTKWGWDVILFHDQITPREITRDELVAEMLPDLRRSYFVKWVDQIAKSRGIKIVPNDEVIALLDPSTVSVAPAPRGSAGGTSP